jgi:hypothetical protein
MARQYAAKPWERYEGERVSALSGNEQRAYELAGENAGKGVAALANIQRFPQANMSEYINPYIKGALDPAGREIALRGQQQQNQIQQQAQSVGAFSGSRQILREQEARKGTEQALSDLYGRGYAEAFDKGAALWEADQDRAIRAAGLSSDMLDRDVSRLISTGQNARLVDQMQKDFDYQQFVEKRDWSGKNAAYLTDVLRGLKGSMTESQSTVTKSKESGNLGGQLLGAAVTIAAAYFTGGASLAAQGAMQAAATSGTGRAGADSAINWAASGGAGQLEVIHGPAGTG